MDFVSTIGMYLNKLLIIEKKISAYFKINIFSVHVYNIFSKHDPTLKSTSKKYLQFLKSTKNVTFHVK